MPLGGGARREKPPEALVRLVGDPLGASAIRFVVNGVEVQARVAPELTARGVVFTSLADAVRTHGDLVQPYLGSIVRDDENKYRALHGRSGPGGRFCMCPTTLRSICRSSPRPSSTAMASCIRRTRSLLPVHEAG